jgi:hypothetical protein
VAVLVDFRPTGKLRGSKTVDVTAALALPAHFPLVEVAVEFWRRIWAALRLAERYLPLTGLDLYQIAPTVSGEMLRPLLESGADIRIHVNNGAVASFVDTVPLLHPYGRLICHDLFVTDVHAYSTNFRSPGKYDGSIVNWVNGPLLAHIGCRKGCDVDYCTTATGSAALISARSTTWRSRLPPDPEQGVFSARRPDSGAGAGAQRRGAGAGRGGCGAVTDRRAVPGRLPRGRGSGSGGDQHRDQRCGRHLGLHVGYGNRYARPSWEGHDDFLFPAVLAQRIRKTLDTFPADKLIINPDCGLRHLFADVARSKLSAMVEGTATVRRTLPTEHPATSTEKPVTTEHLWTSSEPTVEQGA